MAVVIDCFLSVFSEKKELVTPKISSSVDRPNLFSFKDPNVDENKIPVELSQVIVQGSNLKKDNPPIQDTGGSIEDFKTLFAVVGEAFKDFSESAGVVAKADGRC